MSGLRRREFEAAVRAYRGTVEKMNYRELTDELQNRPRRQRSVPYLAALRRERDRRDAEIRAAGASDDEQEPVNTDDLAHPEGATAGWDYP